MARKSVLKRPATRRSGLEETKSATSLGRAGASAAAGAEPLLAVSHISKRFGGTQALDDVSLEVEGGSVLALLGENGAGKSTLIKILAGVHAPDAGEIFYSGAETSAALLPVAFIHQDLDAVMAPVRA
jgi:ribose transport system ATP-binding protein